MNKKQKIKIVQQIQDDNDNDLSDNELELGKEYAYEQSVISKQVPPIKNIKSVQVEQQVQEPMKESVQEEPIRKKKNLTEEHKQKIIENLEKGRAKRKIQAQEKQAYLELLKQQLEKEKELALLAQAEKLKKKYKKQVKTINVFEDEEETEDYDNSEPEYVEKIKPRRKQETPQPLPPQIKRSKAIYQTHNQIQQPTIQQQPGLQITWF